MLCLVFSDVLFAHVSVIYSTSSVLTIYMYNVYVHYNSY